MSKADDKNLDKKYDCKNVCFIKILELETKILELKDKYGRALHDIQYGNHLGAIENRIDLIESKSELFEVSKLDTVKALSRLKKTEDRIEELAGMLIQNFLSPEE